MSSIPYARESASSSTITNTIDQRKAPPPELLFPPAEKLNQNFILGEIRDYIKEFRDVFPNVDLDILLEQVKQVRRKNVHPEVQIRQFLLAFKDAPAFRDAFDNLDEETKKKVEGFRGGASADDIIGNAGFHLPPSPPAKQHFRLLNAFHSLFRFGDTKKKQPKETTIVPKAAEAEAAVAETATAPKIYEDPDQKKMMKVWRVVDISK